MANARAPDHIALGLHKWSRALSLFFFFFFLLSHRCHLLPSTSSSPPLFLSSSLPLLLSSSPPPFFLPSPSQASILFHSTTININHCKTAAHIKTSSREPRCLLPADMDSLVFPQPAPKPLILPRRLSLHSSSRGQRHWYPGGLSPSSPDKDDTHFYYFPTTYLDPQQQGLAQTQVQDPRMAQGTYSVPMFSSSYPPVLFSFGGDRSQNEYVTAHDSARTRPSRRHSVSNGSPWTTIPPRHALHMPVMKIDPTVWRSEHHQRDIYRLMHEGREEEVMKRRGVRSLMDTMTEEEEDDRGGNMSGVVQTADSGRTTDEREKARHSFSLSPFALVHFRFCG